jgi:peroxiredoxin
MRALTWIVAIAVPLAAPAWGAAPAATGESPVPQVGQKAPDVLLPGSDGKGHWLRSFRGKKAVVLAFFPKANTAG